MRKRRNLLSKVSGLCNQEDVLRPCAALSVRSANRRPIVCAAYCLVITATSLLCGCAKRIRVVLCPSIAAISYAPGTGPAQPVVNSYLADYANKHNIQVEVVSPVLANLVGGRRRVERTEDGYSFMVCGFLKPGQVVDYQAIYQTCMDNVPMWNAILRSSTPRNLLQPDTHYADVCIANK